MRLKSRSLFVVFSALALGLMSPLSVAAAEAGAAGEVVHFTTSDGVRIEGQVFHSAADAPQARGGLLFVHEPNRSRRDWAYLADKLSRQGFTSLIFDLRGHGGSLMRGDEELDREIFMDEDFAAMQQDVGAAADFLRAQPGVSENGIQLAGSDLGGSVALLHAVGDPSIRAVLLLSPGLGYDNLNTMGQALQLGQRPLAMVFSVEDSYSKKSTEILTRERAELPTHVEMLYGMGHGAKMLSRAPELEVFMVRWFLGRIFAADGRPPGEVYKPESVEKGVSDFDVEAEKARREQAASKQRDSALKAVDEDESNPERKRWDDEK